jgi:hypoxanthine phosphoribosyltransferase
MTYTDEERTTLSVYQDIHITKDIHKVLAVEDFLESGKSMKKAMGDIKSNDLDARTACLGYLEKTVIMPNYSLGLMAEAPKFPWD